jgi:cytochrome c-type biogenesis protein CcmH
MTLWLILTNMTSVAAAWQVVPLIRRTGIPRDEVAGDIAVYRDQLQEVERDLQDGRIGADQAETARIEIRRRILAAGAPYPAAELSGRQPGLSNPERSFAIISATAIVALGSAVLYAAIGNPDVASASRARETGRMAGALRESAAFPLQHPPLEGLDERTPDGDGEPAAGLPTVEEMTRRLAARLARNPNDTEGWRTLGWSYMNIGRFSDAAEAYAKAIQLAPDNTEFRSGRIEALVGAANGVVTSEAKAAVGDVLKRDPKDVRARYFAGLASEQEGDKAAALAGWTELLNEGFADEAWASDLRNRVSALKRDMGIDKRAVAQASKPAAADGSPRFSTAQPTLQSSRPVEKGPGPGDVQAAEAMLPTDRAAMIRGMVDGLASRLEGSPRDVDGWIKLIRSRMVLGESDLARQALARGLIVFADDAPKRDRIVAAAQELGVSP